MKWSWAVAVAILMSLSLAGCGVLLRQDDVSEAQLRERVGDLATVVRVGSSVVHWSSGTTVDVWVVVSELVESDLQTIVASADEVLAGRDVSFTIRVDGLRLLAVGFPNDFSTEELATEVHYWLMLSEANGTPLGMDVHQSTFGPYRNIWDPDETDLVDWDALRAVPDPSTAFRTYYLDDIVSQTSFPTPEVLAFRDRLAAIQVEEDEALSLDYFSPGFVEVRYLSPDAGTADPTAVPSWPRVREAVAELSALGLPKSNFVVNTEWYVNGASVYLGECSELEDPEPKWTSDELVAALTSSGIDFPLGVSSGFCNDGYE